ncbi:MAG: Co2+/Mg2+ efflux protein ApaG [Rubricoccaceae bacterium]
MLSFDAITEAVSVSVRPVYLDEKSDALARRFVFAYFIRIENRGADEVQLLRRRWLITDADGQTEEIEGDGVVGRQPVIPPGGAHTYHSYCVLRTMAGYMEGSYLMERANGSRFRAAIPRFALRARAN